MWPCAQNRSLVRILSFTKMSINFDCKEYVFLFQDDILHSKTQKFNQHNANGYMADGSYLLIINRCKSWALVILCRLLMQLPLIHLYTAFQLKCFYLNWDSVIELYNAYGQTDWLQDFLQILNFSFAEIYFITRSLLQKGYKCK